MASRSEEVLIYLRAIGASNTKRDIDSVAKSLEKLNSSTGDNTGATTENTEAVQDNTKERVKSKKAIGDEGNSVEELTRRHRKLTTILFDQSTGYKKLAQAAQAARKLDKQRNTALAAEAKEADRINKIRTRMEIQELRERSLIQKRYNAITEKINKDHQKRVLNAERAFRRQRAKALKQAGGMVGDVIGAVTPNFRHPFRLLKYTTLILGALDLIPVVGTALNSLVAGTIASVNGLMPILATMVGMIPSGTIALTQFGIVGTMVFSSLGKYLGKQTGLIAQWKELRKEIGHAGIKGMIPVFRDFTERYIPLLNKELILTATHINSAMKLTNQWLVGEGFSIISRVLSDSNVAIENLLAGLRAFLQIFIRIADAGGGTFKRMTEDLENFLWMVDSSISNNRNGLAEFFERGYNAYKRGARIFGNFFMALYNIFKLSAPLTDYIADRLDYASHYLRNWTESEDGIKAISQYFQDMKEPLNAVGRFLGAVATAIFDISRSPNFVSVMDAITYELIPALTSIIKTIDGRFVRLIVEFVKQMERLATAGLIDALIDISTVLVDIITAIANWYNGLSDFEQKAVVWTVVIAGLFGGMATSIITSIGAIITSIGTTLALFGKLKAARAGAAGAAAVGAGGGGATVVGGTGRDKKPKGRGRAGRVPTGGFGLGGILAGTVGIGVGASLANSGTVTTNGTLNDLDSFFKNENGDTLSKVPGWAGDLNSLATAFEAVKRGAESPLAPIGQFISSVTGAKTSSQLAKEAFGNLDAQLVNMPATQSAALFRQIQSASQKAKVPIDSLVSLFPQYRNKVQEAANPTKNAANNFRSAANAADAMAGEVNTLRDRIGKLPKKTQAKIEAIWNRNGVAAAKRELDRLDGYTATTYIYAKTIRQSYNQGYGGRGSTAAQGGSPVEPRDPYRPRFAGGMTNPGSMYMTGELGPELAITRSGAMSMLGLGGQQLFKPKEDTAIIPASATFDPMGGNYGNAPQWARMALQNAVDTNTSMSRLARSQGRRGDSGAPQYHVDIKEINVRDAADIPAIKEAIFEALSAKERDRRERRTKLNA